MPSLSGRTLRRRPDLVAARAWRATVPGAGPRATGQGSAVLLLLLAFLFLYVTVGRPETLPWAAFLVLIVLSGVMHRPREHGVVVVVSLGCLMISGLLVAGDPEDGAEVLGTFVAGAAISAVTMWRAVARARVGVQGRGGEAVLEDLRAALERRGEMPPLPPRWHAEGHVCSAYDHPFSGDFIVARHDEDAGHLEAVLVDVSGRGLRSAARAVQLSGALDALIGAVPPDELLAAANDYVVRQQWGEGFATAIHVLLDLDSGEFRVWRAGHPPVGVFHGGSGRWCVVDDHIGPALGLLPGAGYRCDEGILRRHDALLLYSDGLVEQHDRALDEGIDRLLGKAVYLVTAGFEGGARRLCEEATSGDTDDRSVVLLWNE